MENRLFDGEIVKNITMLTSIEGAQVVVYFESGHYLDLSGEKLFVTGLVGTKDGPEFRNFLKHKV